MRTPRTLVVLAAAAYGVTAAWACGFPDVTFGPASIDESEAGDPDADLSGVDATSDLEDASEPEPPPILIDGSPLDALVVHDAGGKIDAAGCTTCDCDGDGYNDRTRPDCGSAPGPFDCDDDDTRTHPNQGFLAEKAESPRFGDWNCMNGVEKAHPENVKCEGLTLGLGLTCPDVYGFTSTVACGENGLWVRCKKRPGVVTLDCVVGEQLVLTQLCR